MAHLHELVDNYYQGIGVSVLMQQLLRIRHTIAQTLGINATETPTLESQYGIFEAVWNGTRPLRVEDASLLNVSDLYAAEGSVLHCRYDTCEFTTNTRRHMELHMLFKHRKTEEDQTLYKNRAGAQEQAEEVVGNRLGEFIL